jgi:hypothetical protein
MDREPALDGPPPFLGTWRRVYTVIVVYLVAVILAFGAFTATFNQ